MLSTHFDKESPVQDFLVEASPDEIDGIDPHVENDLERAWVVVLNFDEVELRECLLHIILSGVEIAFNEIQRNMLDVIIKFFDLFDNIFSFGVIEFPFLMFFSHEWSTINEYNNLFILIVLYDNKIFSFICMPTFIFHILPWFDENFIGVWVRNWILWNTEYIEDEVNTIDKNQNPICAITWPKLFMANFVNSNLLQF